jgi:hypothetical protein
MSSIAISKATPFDAAVAEVQLKIEELKTTLATLLRLQAEQGGAPSPTGGSRGGEAEISHDTFFNMTIGEAAKKYLSIVKTTKSTAEIAEGLERGGLKHSSKSFTTTVRSIIGVREDFTRVPNGDWGLTEWYPGMGRGKKPKAKKPKRARKAGPKKMKNKMDAAVKKQAEPAEPVASTKGPQARIEEYRTIHPSASSREIADKLGIRIQTVGLILAKLKAA